MNSLAKWAKRVGLAALAAIALLAALWGISRALYPTDQQLEALAVMQLPEPPEGLNAFAALWTLDRGVPPNEMRQVIEQDAARIAELPQFPDPDDAEAAEFVSASEQYPDLAPSPDDRDLFCRPQRENCLEKVDRDPSTYRALVERNQELLDRIDALADYDFVRQQLPWNMNASLLAPDNAGLTTTRHALLFVEGRVDEALAESCRGISTWRKLGASGDTLILRLLSNLYAVHYHGALLGEMLSKITADHPLPPECEHALAPPPAQELSLCTAMRGEYELITETTGPMLEDLNGRSWWSSLMIFLLYDAEATAAARAQNLAPICGEREIERIATDKPEVEQSEAPGTRRFACLGNLSGCVMSLIPAPAYRSYRIRMQDFGARVKLLATLAWLRENANEFRQLEPLLARRPEALTSPTRDIVVGDDGASLQIGMFDDTRGSTWSVPLPATLRK